MSYGVMQSLAVGRHFRTVASRYRQLRDLDQHTVRRVSGKLQTLAAGDNGVLVLDVGAGTGRYTEAVLRHASESADQPFHGVAYDAVLEMLDSEAAHRSLDKGSIDRTIGLAETLPFADHTFDAMLTFNAVHHFDLPAFLAEAARVVRSNGLLTIYTRTPEQNRRTVWGQLFPQFAERETRLFTEQTLRAAIDAEHGFETYEVREMPWTVRTDLRRLVNQARNRGYSTFCFYTAKEFEKAIELFERGIRERFHDPSAITVQNDHLLLVATRR